MAIYDEASNRTEREPGRNAPCPCGSGKKYKKCCLQKRETRSVPILWSRLNSTLRELSEVLQRYALQTWGDPCIEDAWAEFWGGALPQGDPAGPFEPLFVTWFLFHWLPDETALVAPPSAPSEYTVAAQYLREHGGELEPLARDYLEVARRTPLSFWQIESVLPERGLQLKDVATGREHFVNEVSATRCASQWDILLCKVIGVDGTYVLEGGAPYLMPAHTAPAIDQFLSELSEVERADDAVLLGAQSELIDFYVEWLEAAQSAKPPEMRNTSGHRLVLSTTTSRFRPEHRDRVVMGLGAMQNIEIGDDDGKTARFRWVVPGKRGRTMPDATRATLRVESDRLVWESNSRERNAALTRRLQERFPDVLEVPESVFETPEEIRAQAGPEPPDGTEPLDVRTLPLEVQEQLRAVIEQKCLSWIDEHVPALGGMTPREAVRTSEGRKKVEELLKHWENTLARMPDQPFPFDVNKVRAALGLPGE